MTLRSCAKVTGAIATLVAIILVGMSMKPTRAQADDDDSESRIQIGFRIAPVPQIWKEKTAHWWDWVATL